MKKRVTLIDIKKASINRINKRGPLLLGNINLTLNEGDFAALFGPNGVGKTTLLKWIEENYQKNDCVYLPSSLPEIPGLKVKEVVELGRLGKLGFFSVREDLDKTIVDESIKIFSLKSFEQYYYDELSDGEKKRVLLARSLAQMPKILLLDEPCAFLDAVQRLSLYALLKELAEKRKMAILISSHHWEAVLDVLPMAHLLVNKKILSGVPEDLIIRGDFDQFPLEKGICFSQNFGRFCFEIEDETRPSKMEVAQKWAKHFSKKYKGLSIRVFENDQKDISYEARWDGQSKICPSLYDVLDSL